MTDNNCLEPVQCRVFHNVRDRWTRGSKGELWYVIVYVDFAHIVWGGNRGPIHQLPPPAPYCLAWKAINERTLTLQVTCTDDTMLSSTTCCIMLQNKIPICSELITSFCMHKHHDNASPKEHVIASISHEISRSQKSPRGLKLNRINWNINILILLNRELSQ